MTTTLKTAISYESKLVKRNWLFYLFILGVLGYTVGILIPWDSFSFKWKDFALASSIPLRGIHFLNLFQSLTITFLVCDIQRKQKKAETREVLSPRPIGNGESFLGGFLGILIPFLAVDVFFMTACIFINIFIPDSLVNPWVNLFYLLTRVLPSLVFITGLSLLVNRLVKLPLISWFILVGFLYFSYSYLPVPLHGILDFRGYWLPDSFSSIAGFMYIEDYLLQRSAFLLLGVSFLYFAAPLTKRLPGTPGRTPYFILPAFLLLMLSFSLGYIYVKKFQTRLENRIAYRKAFQEYNKYPTARVLAHEIIYRPNGNKFSATSHMKVANRRKTKMNQFPLFLNPGLAVNKIEADGQNVPFHRDRQVILVEHPLSPSENIELKIEYEGKIDEDIYQTNIPDEEHFAPIRFTSFTENYGKRSAFLSSGFTLLIPEVIWYPMAVAPVALQASKEVNFTHYTLHVENPGEQTVLSQGVPTREGNSVTFHNEQNLTGLSLCMGNYHRRAITVDSVTVELYTYPGNDFYMKSLDEWKALKQPKKLKEVSEKCKQRIEERHPDPYPFKYFKLIETPSSFFQRTMSRRTMTNDNAQPEILFFEERLATITDETPGTLPLGISKNKSTHEYLLTQGIPWCLRDMNIDHLFSGHTNNITSDRYLGIDFIYSQMQKPLKSSGLSITPKNLARIAEKGLQGCIMEEYSLEQNIAIYLKVSHLLAYLTTITTWDSLNQFIAEFNTRARFQEIDFDSFIDEFEQLFGQNIQAYMDEWYTSHEIPQLAIKDLTYKKAEETIILDFKVGNSGETDGIVSVITTYDRGGLEKDEIKNWRSYQIKPGEYKHIIVHGSAKGTNRLNTNFSNNLPALDPRYLEKPSQLLGPLPDEKVTLLAKNKFYPPGEIIVDNEDENFHLIDSANHRLRLADLFSKKEEIEYTNLYFNEKANTWGPPNLHPMYYGESIRSAFTKKAGTGKFKAEWVANLQEAGKYEIFIFRPKFKDNNYPGMKNYYAIYTTEGKKEIVLEVDKDDPDWVSLGTFTLSAGESRVVLDDRGVAFEEHGKKVYQLIVADAVKWIKR
ncbi:MULTISPECIES: golvesin C-terminal-like domain-containing protein [Butyricimonas]|uniref:golvesin C-terminal-like domain-containing protein n=1 Tax=Butyricimonas TaxID=574697 RepID=UPI0007FB357C|nr:MULTISPECIES: hypothetical protein [Butyricimonas]